MERREASLSQILLVPEVTEHIMSFLTLKLIDIFVLRRVCRHWKYTIEQYTFDVTLKPQDCPSVEVGPTIDLLTNSVSYASCPWLSEGLQACTLRTSTRKTYTCTPQSLKWPISSICLWPSPGSIRYKINSFASWSCTAGILGKIDFSCVFTNFRTFVATTSVNSKSQKTVSLTTRILHVFNDWA